MGVQRISLCVRCNSGRPVYLPPSQRRYVCNGHEEIFNFKVISSLACSRDGQLPGSQLPTRLPSRCVVATSRRTSAFIAGFVDEDVRCRLEVRSRKNNAPRLPPRKIPLQCQGARLNLCFDAKTSVTNSLLDFNQGDEAAQPTPSTKHPESAPCEPTTIRSRVRRSTQAKYDYPYPSTETEHRCAPRTLLEGHIATRRA